MTNYQTAKQLGKLMRELRERAGVSTYDVEAMQLRVSRRNLARAEKGDALLNWVTWVEIAKRCEATVDELALVESMAKKADEKGWWEEYRGGMPPQFQRYVSLEMTADRMFIYESETVVGLCQTIEYMQASFQLNPLVKDEAIAHMVELRQQRQRRVLPSDGRLQIQILVTETALASEIGGPEVHRRQLERLRELNRLPNVEVRVLTNESGATAMMAGAFTLLEFDSAEDPDTVYVESLDGCRYIESRDVVDRYRMVFSIVFEQAVPLEEFLA